MQSYRDFVQSPDRGPAIVVHRGAWTKGPENSLLSIGRAYDAGHPVVEVDVQQAACGTLFLMHDATLTRMTGHDEVARRLTMAQLAELRLRDGDGSGAATDQPVTALGEALQLSAGRGYFDLDVKFPELMDETAGFAVAQGARDRVTIKFPVHSAADADRMLRLQARHGVMTMPITAMGAETWQGIVARVVAMQAVMTEVHFDTVDTLRRASDVLRSAGIAVWVDSLDVVQSAGLCDTLALQDPDAVWGVMLDAGVSLIQTDAPDALAAYIAARPPV